MGVVARNCDTIRAHLGHSGVIAVVKSDAYGHGIEAVARVLDKSGILAFAVISLEEALRVRSVTLLPVLIMGYLEVEEIDEAISRDFVLSLYDRQLADLYEVRAAAQGKRVIVHIKVETGLNRLGLQFEEAEDLLRNQESYPHLRVEAVYSHLSTSSNRDASMGQLTRFENLVRTTWHGEQILPLHFANSHALTDFREGFYNAVRLGLALYGVDSVIPGLMPSLECKAKIVQRKKVKAGEGISYNRLFIAPREMEVGVVGIGYAEGLTQALTGKANVLVAGHKTPILGQICMNLCIVDLTGIPGERGDVVTIVGRQRREDGEEEEIRVLDLAEAAGIRHHEILTRFGLALPRVYVNDPLE